MLNGEKERVTEPTYMQILMITDLGDSSLG
jgi:hypothetical protein